MVVYQAANGAIELRGDASKETLLASQAQMAEMFGVQQPAIAKHLKNIYEEGELRKRATHSILEYVQIEGGRSIKRKIEYYNLDAIISVGYRISSKTGTRFRQWATKTLRSYVTDGFAINRKRLVKNYDAFMTAVEGVRVLAPAGSPVDTNSVLVIVRAFADTWFSLDAYDKGEFDGTKPTKKSITLAGNDLLSGIAELKCELVRKGEATDLFASERSLGSVAGIVGNVLQSFGGKDVYPSIEEKAANLLYFMVKNHPFADGNKRSGAFAFAWFLQKAGLLDVKRLTPDTLTALTLLVAESDPRQKEKLIGLVTLLIRR